MKILTSNTDNYKDSALIISNNNNNNYNRIITVKLLKGDQERKK